MIDNNSQENAATTPEKTWDDVRAQRDGMLLDAEQRYNFDSPKEILDAWKDYKQQLRDLPETYKDLKDLNQIEWPTQPNFDQKLTLSALTV
jgi:hypothetical protein